MAWLSSLVRIKHIEERHKIESYAYCSAARCKICNKVLVEGQDRFHRHVWVLLVANLVSYRQHLRAELRGAKHGCEGRQDDQRNIVRVGHIRDCPDVRVLEMRRRKVSQAAEGEEKRSDVDGASMVLLSSCAFTLSWQCT